MENKDNHTEHKEGYWDIVLLGKIVLLIYVITIFSNTSLTENRYIIYNSIMLFSFFIYLTIRKKVDFLKITFIFLLLGFILDGGSTALGFHVDDDHLLEKGNMLYERNMGIREGLGKYGWIGAFYYDNMLSQYSYAYMGFLPFVLVFVLINNKIKKELIRYYALVTPFLLIGLMKTIQAVMNLIGIIKYIS